MRAQPPHLPLGAAPSAAPRKNKHLSPGTRRSDSYTAIISRTQLDCTTAKCVVRFDWGVAYEAAAGTS